MRGPTACAIMLAVLLSGCCISIPHPRSESIPDDLRIAYSDGACHAEWGRGEIIITADGQGVYQSGSGPYENGRFEEERFRRAFSLDADELLALLNAIEGSGFYSLDDAYRDESVMDGSCQYISVTAWDGTKSVAVSNALPPKPYLTAKEAILRLAEGEGR